jgi:hypothetical protein
VFDISRERLQYDLKLVLKSKLQKLRTGNTNYARVSNDLDIRLHTAGLHSAFALSVAAAGATSVIPVQTFGRVQARTSLGGMRADSSWVISTSKFDNSFEAEPYIGNDYIGLRIPAAGMGYVGNLGRTGWPLGTERIVSAIAAGVYAKKRRGAHSRTCTEGRNLVQCRLCASL